MSESRTPLLVDLSLSHFAAKVGSSEPAPGGGSVTAYGGALAAALAEMVAGLTVGRERYASSQETMAEVLAQAGRLRGQLLALVDADTAAYSQVMAAYGLPKETPEQKVERGAAIQEGLKHAVDIPLATAEACVQVLHLAAVAAQFGNQNAASDAAVAALFAHAALQGAIRNVRINLDGIRDAEFRAIAEARLAGLLARGESALRRATGK
jgi:methenyltetrahydrofolate cyclohydrolase